MFKFQVRVIQLSIHLDAQTAVWDGWELIVDIRVPMESKYQWTVEFASVTHVMLVGTFLYSSNLRQLLSVKCFY